MASAMDIARLGISAAAPMLQGAAQVGSALSSVTGTAERNSAASAEQAAQLRDWQEDMQRKTMEYNSAEAAKNRDWQQMMSNTAHQREVADLKAAGLNPILSASGGNGAAVTSGSSASASTPAGAKGDVDTSANSALVSLLGSWISSQTALENQRVSAQSNLAVADKYNAANELIARLTGEYNLATAGTYAGATRYAADQNLAASKLSSESAKAVAATHAAASNYAARKSSVTSITNNQANIENAKYLAENYPNTTASLANVNVKKFVDNLDDLGLFSALNALNNPFNSGAFAGRSGAGRK